MDDFYKGYILDHYRNPRNFGSLERVDASPRTQPALRRHDPHELAVDGEGRVNDVKFSGKGCAIFTSLGLDAHREHQRDDRSKRSRSSRRIPSSTTSGSGSARPA